MPGTGTAAMTAADNRNPFRPGAAGPGGLGPPPGSERPVTDMPKRQLSPPRPAAGPVLACLICLMPDPPPQQTCTGGHDHHVGVKAGCPDCGRLAAACALRPCSARRG
jgi:hypothetical protein